MHFRESFVCEKAEFCESEQILICLHSLNPCLAHNGEFRNGSSRSLCKTKGGRNPHSRGCP